jgi:hypothetical protein
MSAAAATAGVAATDATSQQVAFEASRDQFDVVLGWLEGTEAAGLTHDELEARLQVDARELFRQLFQDHLDLRALQEQRVPDVVDADGTTRGTVESGHRRGLATVFGPVDVERVAYRRRGHPNLHPADATLNLPVERHSHGLRRLAALEAARGSYDGAVEAIERACGQQLGKRQVEALAQAAAVDFDDFYTSRLRPVGEPDDVLVISCDGKGVVMRPDGLRTATRKAAEHTTKKLATRLSKGEKRNRKRMAEVGAVYDAAPAVQDRRLLSDADRSYEAVERTPDRKALRACDAVQLSGACEVLQVVQPEDVNGSQHNDADFDRLAAATPLEVHVPRPRA